MDTNQNKKLASFLVSQRILPEQKANLIVEKADRENRSLWTLLVPEKIIPEDSLVDLQSRFYNMPKIHLSEISIPESVLKLVPYSVASKQKIISFERDGKLSVALVNPENRDVLYYLEKKTGLPVLPFLASESEIEEALSLYSHELSKAFEQIYESVFHEKLPVDWSTAIEKIVDALIHYAKQKRASDIHIEPRSRDILIRYRIDGMLHDIICLPKALGDLIVSRVKVLANMRTDEHFSAQDGRIRFVLQDQEFSIRVSVLPTYDGEKVVLRLLTAVERKIDLGSLGFAPDDVEKITRNYKKPHGMILVTGPTGSGKTTTLYSILKDLNVTEVNITTLEDPIEYKLEGMNQIQVNPHTNLTFANGLRSVLRQDPNIIMVGEIRDEETASIAINAALTGHLVLSTLHTNSAAATLPRLMEMGVEPFLVASTVNLVIAQRLLRKLCSKCKVLRQPTPEEKAVLQDPDFDGQLAFIGMGCDLCGLTCYHGRTAIAEVIEMTDSMREGILKKLPPKELEAIAKKESMNTLFEDGVSKVKYGITSLAELLRVCME